MGEQTELQYNIDSIFQMVKEEVDAVYVIDAEKDTYISLKDNAMFSDMFNKTGSYLELSRALMFHFCDNDENITPEYHVFLPTLNKFNGKYSQRITVFYKKIPYVIQMTIYPLANTGKHIMFLNEMDNSDYMQEFYTQEKEKNIRSTYLFTMLVDLTIDICNSVNIAEMSDSPVNCKELKYSQWRMMIVNMIFTDDQPMFLQYTDPEYLKEHLLTRRSMSFDCQMQNLNGKFIWVKLIFNKVEALHNDNFRFVFMVQDIHESSIRLIEDLKRYEELSNLDSLTGIYNHGKIESELYKSVDKKNEVISRLSLIMFDIDHFKNVNDTYGHAAGDYILKTLVSIIKKQFAKYDILFGRWGGEEFIGVCNNLSKEQVYIIAEELRKIIEEYKFDIVGHITCSMGVVEVADKEEAMHAFERLDKALYTAKTSGRNRVICG